MQTKKIITCIIFLTIILFPAFSADEEITNYYEQGSQVFSFRAGPNFPLFLWFPFDEDLPNSTDKLNIGGYGSIGWDIFTSRDFALGAEVGYSFNKVVNQERYISVPILFNMSYFPSSGDFTFPLSLGIGGVYNSYKYLTDQVYFGQILAPRAGALWHVSKKWALGVETSYWFMPEIYFGDSSSQTAFGNFLQVSFTLQYTNE